MSASRYVMHGGEAGRERLRVLARVLEPTTRALFERVGIASDAVCHDAGCGGGDVSRLLAGIVRDGRVVGTDMDEAKLALARKEAEEAALGNVEFRVGDVMQPAVDEESTYDLVYARFLLTHLSDPALAVGHMVTTLRPGGAVVVEDIDYRAHFCEPASEAFDRYVDLYYRTTRDLGADPDIGPSLPILLLSAGLQRVDMNIIQPAGLDGDVKLAVPLTVEAIGDAVVAAGHATADEIASLATELYEYAARPDTVLCFPRIVQAWGYRPG